MRLVGVVTGFTLSSLDIGLKVGFKQLNHGDWRKHLSWIVCFLSSISFLLGMPELQQTVRTWSILNSILDRTKVSLHLAFCRARLMVWFDRLICAHIWRVGGLVLAALCVVAVILCHAGL